MISHPFRLRSTSSDNCVAPVFLSNKNLGLAVLIVWEVLGDKSSHSSVTCLCCCGRLATPRVFLSVHIFLQVCTVGHTAVAALPCNSSISNRDIKLLILNAPRDRVVPYNISTCSASNRTSRTVECR